MICSNNDPALFRDILTPYNTERKEQACEDTNKKTGDIIEHHSAGVLRDLLQHPFHNLFEGKACRVNDNGIRGLPQRINTPPFVILIPLCNPLDNFMEVYL